ncbi:MAG: hypothetical protein Q7U98_10575 [Methylicorpusculum sp.]|uniref:hypothetical protein n=1 Tax=Methylicorpusculum sp. TaxID=2713644 RepID=UPI0027166B5A|nr:hypothetical protein [Methylicorpusculum sp.]MDO8845372.1 hypothetical protein [Methylicorpusculum sp.]MDO8939592.1 hypothetical protein [Methylicorpusculum sp.]MDP2201365.1 hypothetical protein [Methylicorpusculum sp.]
MFYLISKLLQLNTKKSVMLAGMRASSAMDGKLRAIHASWISAIPAEMTTYGSRL